MIIRYLKIATVWLVLLSSVNLAAQNILVPPYLQPGNSPTLLKEQKVVIWQTDSVPGNYTVEYEVIGGKPKIITAKTSVTSLHLKNKTTLLYRASLSKIKTDMEYTYRVKRNDSIIASNTFKTRTKKNQTRFVVFGDCGAGTPQQARIAYQVYQQKPDFVLVTGDNVYRYGLESEYRSNFFPYYTSPKADTTTGAPLMNSIPFYMILGNHDTYGNDFDKNPDGLAYYYYNDLPLNGFHTENVVKLSGNEELIKAFKENTSGRYPKMSNFSFDYGNVHITCLDANPWVNPLNPPLVKWLAEDVQNSKADWKIVSFHHPGFNSSKAHYDYQQMRLLSPVLEQLNIDLVLSGHVHNYQRSVPLKFDPKLDSTGTHYVITPEGRVDGNFTLDHQFDGNSNTKPKGIIYIVSGAGGAPLYDPSLSGKPELWVHEPKENWAPFTAKMVSDIHSFTIIETEGKKLVIKQMNAQGEVFDQVTITK
jgi:predicted MPP superfamily phosphohydrolase